MKKTYCVIKQALCLVAFALLAACSSSPEGELLGSSTDKNWNWEGNVEVKDGVVSVSQNSKMILASGNYKNFELEMELQTVDNGKGYIQFHTDNTLSKGYKIAINNDRNDQQWWRMTGSLLSVRNLTKSFARDNEWFKMRLHVNGQNIAVYINDNPVVEYVEPAQPYRISPNENARVSNGTLAVVSNEEGKIQFKSMKVTSLPENQADANFPVVALDEQKDPIIKLHQEDFPVLDYHVHLKGGLTKERAAQQSRQTGINYAIAPNCGLKFPVTTDQDIYNFIDTMRTQPFILAMQAEGREWLTLFSEKARGEFDYIFSDALTFFDNKNRRTRLWINDEVWIENEEKYMDLIVEKSCAVMEEPIDIFVNPTFLPEQMNDRYDQFWTDARIDKFVTALVKNGKALEINELYKIPSKKIIMKAKEAGVKFTFGSNNVTPNVSDLGYSLKMKEECGLTAENMYKPKVKR